MSRRDSTWIPEIMYEEHSQIPFIEVPEGEEDPALLFIFLNKNTGETEPGPDGEELPVHEMYLHQFVDLEKLKNGLSEQEYDKVRGVLGLDPLQAAVEKGKALTQKIRENVEN